MPPVTFLSAADVEVDAERRRFSSSIDGVRLAGAEPTEPDGRPREIALRRDRRACQTTPGVCVVSSGSILVTSRGAPGRSSSRRSAQAAVTSERKSGPGKYRHFACRATATLPTRARRPVPLCATSKPAPLEKYRLDWFCSVFTVLFRSLAVLDTTVGHAMDVLSPFISVLFHGQSS